MRLALGLLAYGLVLLGVLLFFGAVSIIGAYGWAIYTEACLWHLMLCAGSLTAGSGLGAAVLFW